MRCPTKHASWIIETRGGHSDLALWLPQEDITFPCEFIAWDGQVINRDDLVSSRYLAFLVRSCCFWVGLGLECKHTHTSYVKDNKSRLYDTPTLMFTALC